jgi:Ca2+-transporting ATPase
MPTNKLALVEAFKADGHIVAMTGDGVNDGPALAAAHIGVAMGLRGSDVAREAAHIVLLDDRFASIVSGIELGRRIAGNLRKALTYITAIHVPIAGLALAPILMGLPPMLLPAHVVLMELIIDPTCSLAFEAEPGEKDAMLKPPRPQSEPLFGARDLTLGAVQGVAVFLGVFAIYVLAVSFGLPEAESRGLAFATLIIGNLTLALSDALPKGVSPFARENLPFWAIAVVALSVVAAGLYFPPLAALLRFAPPEPADLALAALLGLSAGGGFGMWRRLLGSPASPRAQE